MKLQHNTALWLHIIPLPVMRKNIMPQNTCPFPSAHQQSYYGMILSLKTKNCPSFIASVSKHWPWTVTVSKLQLIHNSAYWILSHTHKQKAKNKKSKKKPQNESKEPPKKLQTKRHFLLKFLVPEIW